MKKTRFVLFVILFVCLIFALSSCSKKSSSESNNNSNISSSYSGYAENYSCPKCGSAKKSVLRDTGYVMRVRCNNCGEIYNFRYQW